MTEFKILGTTILPALCKKPEANQFSSMKGIVMANTRKYALAPFHRTSSPPSQRGRGALITIPNRAINVDTIRAVKKPCLATRRALCSSFAPMYCATWTENPAETAEPTPPINHVLVDTRPIAADAFAPRLPTMAESIYCMAMVVIWVKIAGTLSSQTRWSWGFNSIQFGFICILLLFEVSGGKILFHRIGEPV